MKWMRTEWARGEVRQRGGVRQKGRTEVKGRSGAQTKKETKQYIANRFQPGLLL